LAACSTSSAPPGTTTAPQPIGDYVAPSRESGSWQIEGSGEFVTGTAVVCTATDPILIEDSDALATPEVEPVASMLLQDGLVVYATSWPGDEVGVGVIDGTGSYAIELDDGGAPLSGRGIGRVVFVDEDGAQSERDDAIRLTFTSIPTPDYCTPVVD
jgi:N-acetylglucosamine kinase-like BadF-type ATPase